jgi:uncharacterized protein YraI
VFRFLFLAAALSLAGATTASASWITRDVNVRSGPGTGHHVRHVAHGCTPVDVHGHRGGWVRVSTRHGGGWVSGRYVSHDRPHHCGARGHGHHDRVYHDHRPQVHIHVIPHHPRVHHPRVRHPIDHRLRLRPHGYWHGQGHRPWHHNQPNGGLQDW